MNRFKFFVLTNCLFHVCFLFTCPLPFMANIVGVIPILVYSTVLTFIVKEIDSYKTILLKSFLIFIVLAIVLTIISDMILVGMILSIIGIVLGLLLQPLLLRYSK